LQPWLAWLSIATIILGTIGALAATRLAGVVANLVLISSGTLLLGVAAATPEAIAAMLTYLVHTVVWTAALFLLADAIADERGAAADTLDKAPRMQSFVGLGAAYLIAAVAISGAPPLSGFIAKLMVLRSLHDTASWVWAWSVLLISGFITALVLARAASAYFWEPGKEPEKTATETLALHMTSSRQALWITVVAALMLVPFAPTLAGYTSATAEQILQRQDYRAAVIGPHTTVDRERRPGPCCDASCRHRPCLSPSWRCGWCLRRSRALDTCCWVPFSRSPFLN
jgi:multicomponent K+:H+ antiporter subunit D